MIVKLISHITALGIGFFIAFFIFNSSNENLQNSAEDLTQSTLDSEKVSSSENLSNIDETPATNLNDDDVQRLKKLVSDQAAQIKQLQLELNSQTKVAENTTNSNEQKKLETISMEDFENRIKGSFRHRFKGVAIELKEKQVAEFEKMFETNPQKTEWGVEFENQISNFITQGDPNGLHFVEEVNCISHMCRLVVQSNEQDSWQSLYSSMTQENWFNTMTLVNKTDIPGTHVYYIPKPQEFE